MSVRAFVDTNVIVYAYDGTSSEKQKAAIDLLDRLWSERNISISSQVIQEFAVAVRRNVAKAMNPTDVRRVIRDFRDWDIVLNDAAAVLGALEIEERYQVSFWDALILQAAQSAGAEILYTEDLSHGQKYGNVRVVNPFKR